MKTADGYINVTAIRERHYQDMMHVLGFPELATDERFDSREKRIAREGELMPIVRQAFTQKTTAEWRETLTEAGMMNAPVSDYGHYLANEHVRAVESLGWLEHQGIGTLPLANIPGLASMDDHDGLSECPHIGQHTQAILDSAGYPSTEIAALVKQGVIRGG